MEMTALDGALIRRDGKWYWSDGTPEPRVRDMPLAHVAPNWRCITYGDRTYVEIPKGWRQKVRDRHVLVAVEYLIHHGKAADIFADEVSRALDYHRVSVPGYLIPVDEWDRIMSGPIGAEWDIDDEPDILARAEKFKERG